MQKLSKKLMILSITILIGLVIVSCGESSTSETTTEEDINHTIDMDTVYYQGQGYEITYKDLYNSIIVNDGVDQLATMVDQDLLEDFLQLVTTEEIDDKRTQLIYGTKDQEVIDDLEEKQKEKMQVSYENGMHVLGYGQDDIPYLRLLVARDLYVEDLLTNPSIEDNNIYLDADDIADEYMDNKYGEVNALLIRFDDKADVTQLLIDNDLVNYNNELRLYIGETPLAETPSYRITDDNTRSLTDNELLEYFIQFYNLQDLGDKPLIDESATLQDLLVLEELRYQYEDLKDINTKLGNLVFSTLSSLSDDSNESYYTYKAYEVNLSSKIDYYLVMNLDRDYFDLTDFEGDEDDLKAIIGQELYEDILGNLLDEKLNDDSYINKRLETLRENNGFEIFDYYLRLDYENVLIEDYEITNFDQSDFVIASYNDKDILVKDLMAFALERKAPLYLVHASQLKLLRLEHYGNVYCDDDNNCPIDFTENDSEAMASHIKEFAELEKGFLESDYTTVYSFEDYLYLAYGVKNDQGMIDNYVMKTLEPLFLYDYILENQETLLDEMLSHINDFYENYFSLDVSHLLIYVDNNNDGRPDDFEDFYSELADPTSFDTLVDDFRSDILLYLDDNDDNLAGFLSVYKAASKDNETWGQYKDYGLNVLQENLSSNQSLTYINSFQKYEESFVDGLINLYQDYQLAENNSKDLLYSDLIETSYGLHLIKAGKGSDFDRPSAEFSATDNLDGDFSEDLYNDNDRVSKSQLQVFINYRIYDIAGPLVDLNVIYDMERPELPTHLKDVFDLFVKNVHDAYYSQAILNTAMVDFVVDGQLIDDSVYSEYFSQAEIISFLDDLKDVYASQMDSQFES